MRNLLEVLKGINEEVPFKNKENVCIYEVSGPIQGVKIAKSILYKVVDIETVLFLSGGRTPKDLYTVLSQEKLLRVGAVGLVDERFGSPLHEQSNELMIQNTGFLDFLKQKDIPFYPILQDRKSREDVAKEYDDAVRNLQKSFSKRVAILGIGGDGHTAGIAPNRSDFENSIFSKSNLLVSEFDDPRGIFKQRVTMTFEALSQMDLLIVLVFGEDKGKALQMMFKEGSFEEVPARFLKSKGIAEKVLLITDQRV